jgi:hypothetical protein
MDGENFHGNDLFSSYWFVDWFGKIRIPQPPISFESNADYEFWSSSQWAKFRAGFT